MSIQYPPVGPNANETNDLGTPTCRWKDFYAKNVHADNFGGLVGQHIDAMQEAIDTLAAQVGPAAAPGSYIAARDDHWGAGSADTLLSPTNLWLNIGGYVHKLSEQVTLDVTKAASWDTKASLVARSKYYAVGKYVYAQNENDTYIYMCTTAGTTSSLEMTWPTTVGDTLTDGDCVWVTVANPACEANRAGEDSYIYALASETYVPEFVLSTSSTVPNGYTADNSRKVGGYHGLCADAGTNISDNNNIHPLSGYTAGQILPASVWSLDHRPKSEPEGMAYDEGLDLWIDIYLASWTGSFSADSDADTLRLETVYGAATADGASAEKFHCHKFEQIFGRQKKRLLYQREFMVASIGSNQGTAIAGSADATTTGGHKDTAGRRMISNIGLEDCCGFLWQWGSDVGSAATGSSWGAAYDANDRYVAGQAYGAGAPYRVLLGGAWDASSSCGSRGAVWNGVALALGAAYGARGASEPLGA